MLRPGLDVLGYVGLENHMHMPPRGATSFVLPPGHRAIEQDRNQISLG